MTIQQKPSWSTWPTHVTAGSDHYFHTCGPIFQNRTKQNNFQVSIVIAIGAIVGLAEGIIHGNCFFKDITHTNYW